MICHSLSPDGSASCTLIAGHEQAKTYHIGIGGEEAVTALGQPTCKNTYSGQRWCGLCGVWRCRRHGVRGHSKPRSSRKP